MADSNQEEPGEITQLLNKWSDGDPQALNELVPMVYGHLRALAGGYLGRESQERTLQATALVNEVYLRLEGKTISFTDRDHFFRATARMMRRLLVSKARSRQSLKRGQDAVKTLDLLEKEPEDGGLDLETLLTVEEALGRLESRFPRLARIVELRVFLGLENHEIGEVLNISLATVKREWVVAKRRLFATLNT